MDSSTDAYGQLLLAQLHSQIPIAELIERDDGYLDTGSDPGMYVRDYAEWSSLEQRVVDKATGRALDIGSGAGRHALYLQRKGLDVTAIDNSPGAIEVCRQRGVKRALVRPITEIGEFGSGSFDTILMLGNNFGLFADADNARRILAEMARVTTPEARIIAGTRDPYRTNSPDHLEYHEWNRQRGRMGGQIRMRVRYRRTIGEWFDYLFVSPDEMREILIGTDWEIENLYEEGQPQYFAVIGRRSSAQR